MGALGAKLAHDLGLTLPDYVLNIIEIPAIVLLSFAFSFLFIGWFEKWKGYPKIQKYEKLIWVLFAFVFTSLFLGSFGTTQDSPGFLRDFIASFFTSLIFLFYFHRKEVRK